MEIEDTNISDPQPPTGAEIPDPQPLTEAELTIEIGQMLGFQIDINNPVLMEVMGENGENHSHQ